MSIGFLRILFPERCRGCQKPGIALCARCLGRIHFADPLDKRTFAVFDYGNPLVRATIRDLKYHKRSESASALVAAAIPHISEYLGDRLQSSSHTTLTIVPIPEHTNKLKTRGFNQSALIASMIHNAMPDTVIAPVLQKTIPTLPQAHLNRSRRLKNVAHTMECSAPIDSHSIYVIVDDVTTTGATFDEARRALYAGGAKSVCAVAIAHGYARK